MSPFFSGIRLVVLVGSLALLSCALLKFETVAQEKRFPQTAGVDDSKMGAYRALAQLAFAASQKGDNVMAAKLGRILERTWDKAEGLWRRDCAVKNKSAALPRDRQSMDRFIGPLVAHPAANPDAAALKAAYNSYIEKLKLAD